MFCNNCDNECAYNADICPHCETLLPSKRESNQDSIVRIIAQYSLDIYKDVSKFNTVIRNVFCNDDKLCRLLQIIVAYGGAASVYDLRTCTEDKFAKEFDKLVLSIDDRTFIPSERFLPALELLLIGIGRVKSSADEKLFIIEDGVLFRYIGDGGDVTIPDYVTSIGANAFAECKALTQVRIPTTVTSIGNGAFADCSNLNSILIPKSVTVIGENAFESCSRLTSFMIPDSISTIPKNMFRACTSLSNVTIPHSINSIEDFAFVRCSNLVNINLPVSVTSIGVGAFADCSNLRDINITKVVTFIGPSAFMRCESLDDFTGKLIKKMSPLAIK